MIVKYAKIEKDKIAKFKTIQDTDIVIIPKLLAHDYRIVEEMPVPAHDYITQTLTDSFEIQKDKVLRVWTVTEREFTEAVQMKKETIENEALDDIRLAFESTEQQVEVNKVLVDKNTAVVKIVAARNNADLRAIKYKETKEVG